MNLRFQTLGRSYRSNTRNEPAQSVHLLLPPELDDVLGDSFLHSTQHRTEVARENQTASNDVRLSRKPIRCPENFPERVTAEHVVLPAVKKLHQILVRVRRALLAMM